ncbi:MAG: galactosyldiacylglycerol synthase [Chloroflexi bacterium]|nr:galactosyldiacylglycerol synthase [Chloroflexota bacterium]
MPIHLTDLADGREIGTLTDEQFAFLADRLESEDADDDDYYLNKETLDTFEQQGADPHVVALLRTAMANRAEMDIRWQRVEEDLTAHQA